MPRCQDSFRFTDQPSSGTSSRRSKPSPRGNSFRRQQSSSLSIADAAWGQILRVLALQAVKLGKFAILYPKSGTTQDCSGCGTKAKSRLELKDRVFSCDQCGYSAPRDRNSARNLDPRRRGWTGRGNESTGALPACGR